MNSAGAKDRRAETSKSAPSDNSTNPKPIPFKPRQRLFVILLLIFAIWVGWLLTMYFQAVYPRRHPAPAAPSTSAAAL